MNSSVNTASESSSEDDESVNNQAMDPTAILSSSSSSSDNVSAGEEEEDEDDEEDEPSPKRRSPNVHENNAPPPDAPVETQPPDEYDRRFEDMCRRLPATMQMRPAFIPYTSDVGYLDLQDQVTDVRGHLESAATLYAEQQRATQEQFRELFADVDRILAEEGLANEPAAHVAPNAPVQQNLRGAVPPPPPPQHAEPTQPAAHVAPLPPAQPLPGGGMMGGGMQQNDAFDPAGMAAMFGDVMQQQVTFNTAPLPKHVERERAALQRYAADGIRDVRTAVENCVICSYMSSTDNTGTRILDECMQKFKAICRWVVTRPMQTTCVSASNYWNKEFVIPCRQFNVPAPPTITASHVELCLLNCNHNLKGLLTLRREIAVLEDTLEVLAKNQLYVRQEVAGVPTNKYQVTQSGYKIMHDLMNQLMGCRKLEWGAMTVIERDNHDTPINANPLHDSVLRPRKRSELTRERESLNAAAKRNSKNFRGSSGMGGNTGVGVLQVGGYGGGVMGAYGGGGGGGGAGGTARDHQNHQRHQLFRGGL